MEQGDDERSVNMEIVSEGAFGVLRECWGTGGGDVARDGPTEGGVSLLRNEGRGWVSLAFSWKSDGLGGNELEGISQARTLLKNETLRESRIPQPS